MSRGRDAMGRLADWLERTEGFSSITLSRDEDTGGYLLTLSVTAGPMSVDLAHSEGTELGHVIDTALAESARNRSLLEES